MNLISFDLHNLVSIKEKTLYILGAAGFNMNYFFLALLQSSLMVIAEKVVRREVA